MAKGKYEYWLTDEGLLLLEGWARDGLTDEQIAKNIGVNAKTLYEWKNKYSKICNTLKKGKEVIDRQVENALLKRALGYEYTETTKELELNPGTLKRELIVTKEVVKQVAGDTTAQIFWLKNRKRDVWRDKQDIEHSGSVDIKKQYEQMSDEELDEVIKKYEKINST